MDIGFSYFYFWVAIGQKVAVKNKTYFSIGPNQVFYLSIELH